MHTSSYIKMSWFKEKYLNLNSKLEILDVGSFDNSGEFNYSTIFDETNWDYTGLDLKNGNNVDIVVEDIYNFEEIEDNSYDVVVSGQFFEHLKFFWKTASEIERILKPEGFVCIIVPSAGPNHGPDTNCYKFYEDGIRALAKYVDFEILHSSTDNSDKAKPWHDTCLVAKKKNKDEYKENGIKNKINKLLVHDKSSNSKIKIKYEKLKKENISLKKSLKEKELIIKKRQQEPTATSFCNDDYVNFYYKNDFDKLFSDMLRNLPPESKNLYKYIFLRNLISVYMRKDTLYTEDELKGQKEYREFSLKNVSKNKVSDFKFIDNDYNLHCFMDTHLTEEDEKFLKNKDIIDAGAYTGDSTLPFSKITSSNVYGFEPFKESYEKMKQNIELNNIKNIIPINASLSNIDGEITLYLSGQNFQGITSDSEIRKYDKKLVVPSRTIDSFVEEHNLNVGFIKVDVEGAEQELLEGAINTIKTQKPILFLSIYHNPSDFFNIKPWIENLNLGYEFKINKEQSFSFIADTMLECRVKKENG